MKKWKLVITMCLVAVMSITACVHVMAETNTVSFVPGVYRAESMGHNAPIVVDVTFSENKIEAINVVEHAESKSIGNWAMDAISKEILERQSLDVDALSGATITSVIFRNIVTDAVKQAGADPKALMISAPESMEKLPDENVDVVVVGAGGAGLAATLEAHNAGLNVILIEQLGIIGGSTTRAGGIGGGGNSKVMAQHGITGTTEEFYDVITAPLGSNLHEGLLDVDYVKGFANRVGSNIDWLSDMGTKFGNPFTISGMVWHYGIDNERVCWQMVEALQKKMDENGIDYRLNTKGLELIQNDNSVVGIAVEAPNGTTYNIYAEAVILATGGYVANKELVAKYAPGYEKNTFDVSVGANGSGLIMAETVGGVPTLMNYMSCHALAAMYNGGSRSLNTLSNSGAIAVNKDGKRFANELASYMDLTPLVMAQDEVFVILNEELFDTPKVKNDHGLSNIKEMYVVKDTIEELANELGIHVENLKETIKTYGEYVKNGVDEEFGKPASALTIDLSSGPFYGVKVRTENHTAFGGIKTDNSFRVLRADGSVIEGLYAAGEVALFKEAGRSPLLFCIDSARLAAQDVAEKLSK